MDLSEITPVAQDYLKAIWSATEWGDPPITTKGLAERMGTTAPSVTDTVKRLAAQGLVEHQPYRPVTLTALGEQYAVAMVRRHRLLETFLVTTLGYAWEEVHEEAERLEHAASEAMIERIDATLGHPTADPHGDPIPTADGDVRHPPGTTRLTEAVPGEYRSIRVSDADPGLLTRLRAQDIAPGTALTVTGHDDDGATTALLPGAPRPVVIPAEDSRAIWVRPS
jgi:DtxR family Mn-dependent transcriptional regulator